jgi:zinc transport system substrate-binding protein
VRRILAVAAVAAAVLASATGACGRSSGPRDGGGSVDVVAGFYPLAEAASRVGGDRVSVQNLTPAGVEPHDLELKPSQVDALEDADVVVYVGGGFQPAVAKVATRRGAGSVDALEAAAGGDEDPHFWLDPTRLASAVDAIAAALGEVDPAGRATFEANAAAYRAELATLDDELSAGLANCERRELVTSHAAFSYLAKRYDLTQLAIAALSPSAEPSAARLAELSSAIKAHHATTVFSEELVSPRVAEALAREAGVKTAVLSPLEGLTKSEQAAGDDYASVMRRNLAALRTALGCT